MPKVQNRSGKGIPLLRWRVLHDGRILDPSGKVCDELPDDVGYSDQAKRLCNLGLLKVVGYNWFPKAEKVEVPPPFSVAPEVRVADDLTVLVNVGKGRARKLADVGVESFAAVVVMGAADLSSLLDITMDMAMEMVEDAASRVE